MFFFTDYNSVTNYAQDNKPYTYDIDMNIVRYKLEDDSLILLQWFKNNYMKLNEDKCVSYYSEWKTNLSIMVGAAIIKNSSMENY